MMLRRVLFVEPPAHMIKIIIDDQPRNWFADVHNWCVEHCNGEWTSMKDAFYFEDEADAILFKLSKVQ